VLHDGVATRVVNDDSERNVIVRGVKLCDFAVTRKGNKLTFADGLTSNDGAFAKDVADVVENVLKCH
jgi:hypothetical protein